MTRSRRTLKVEALDALLRGSMAAVAKARDWELLEEIARIARDDAPIELATSDPALFASLRKAITSFHLRGWSAMTPERVRHMAGQPYAPATTATEAPRMR